MKWAKDMMGAETVLLQLTLEQRPGFDLTWGYRSGTGAPFPPSVCAVCPCQSVLSVHRDSTCAVCPCQSVLSVLYTPSFTYHLHCIELPIESAIQQ